MHLASFVALSCFNFSLSWSFVKGATIGYSDFVTISLRMKNPIALAPANHSSEIYGQAYSGRSSYAFFESPTAAKNMGVSIAKSTTIAATNPH
jgi:hypothetical protein